MSDHTLWREFTRVEAERDALRAEVERLRRQVDRLVDIIRKVHGNLLDARIDAALAPTDQPLNAPGDLTWQQAALRSGERVATAGPRDYYKFTPREWLDWITQSNADAARAGDTGVKP